MNTIATARVAAGAVAAALALGVSGAPAGAASRQHHQQASVVGDTLNVTTGPGSDRIALRLAPGDTTTLQVDFGDDGSAEQSFDRATFSKILVSTGSGADALRVDQSNGTFADEELTYSGGSGDDSFTGGDGNELFLGGSGDDSNDGNRGNDRAELGSGNDAFRWDPGDGSDTIEGQSGTDTLDFNGANVAEKMQLTPNGSRALFLRDIAGIRMDMDGVERLDLTALGAADTVDVDDMRGTDFRQADVDLSGAAGGGDGAADTVTVAGTAGADSVAVGASAGEVQVRGLQTDVNIAGPELADTLAVQTFEGNDDVTVDPASQALMTVAVDLGSGQI
jgi:Ca2+-binding RTX toxin-like protein